MGLSKQQRFAMIDFLVPLLNDLSKRQMHMHLLFPSGSVGPDLDLHGAPRETTIRIVLALETYHTEPGKPALFELLEQVSYEVGVDHQTLIEEWQRALLTPASPQAVTPPAPSIAEVSQPQSVGTSPVVTPAAHSRAESFAIPAPFAWVTVPAGKVTLEGKNESYLKTETTFDVPAFGISKYPITNAQFTLFVEAGGYRDKKWWTKQGWKWISNHRDTLFNSTHAPGSTCPTVVIWYEAMAFCSWLRQTIGEPVYLPTEQQWQRAAQGEDERLYPWGNDWDAKRCNNQGSSLTPVDQYEALGKSPYDVVDMVGNAAEWTLTHWRTGEQGGDGDLPRVIRGGSYENQHLNFLRVTTRTKADPLSKCGFRIVRRLE